MGLEAELWGPFSDVMVIYSSDPEPVSPDESPAFELKIKKDKSFLWLQPRCDGRPSPESLSQPTGTF